MKKYPIPEVFTMPAGYSGTPLHKKLGIETGFRVNTRNAPSDYMQLLAPLPEDVAFSTRFRTGVDLWHLFTKSRSELETVLPIAKSQIKTDGMIWVSWPKKSSGIRLTVTEDTSSFLCRYRFL